MWIWFATFALALAYKCFKRESLTFERVRDIPYKPYSYFLVTVLCFTTTLLYTRQNVSESTWQWTWYTAHAVCAVVCMVSSVMNNIGHPESLSTLILVAAGLCFGRVFEPSISPWIHLSSLCGLSGAVTGNSNAAMVSLAIFIGYGFFLFVNLPNDLSWVMVGTMFLIAITRAVSLLLVEQAVHTMQWSLILAAYNVVQLFHIPIDLDDTIDGDELLVLVLVGVVLFILQWMTLVWIHSIDSISYGLGVLVVDMILLLASDISTEATYAGWVCTFGVVLIYSMYPLNQTQPPLEPSVPPLPGDAVPPQGDAVPPQDDAVPPQVRVSPKMKHEDSKPSAPLDLPEPPSEVPTQGEIV